jgi:heat shock protein HtpX
MAIDFWAAQKSARKKTAVYFIVFILLTFFLAAGAENSFREFAGPDYQPGFPLIGVLFCGVTLVVAGFNYLMFRTQGGSYVARSVGARQVLPYTQDPQERQLINIVQEMAVASSLPMPQIYILDAQEINAFAAGMKPEDAAITVTRGTMTKLTRNEIQGVIGHEFSHIANADMRIGLQIAAMVAGFYFLFIAGLRILQFTSYQRDDGEGGKKGNPLALAAIVLLIAGLVAWFVGTLFRCAISRQREYLADATAVQYTRNPEGIIGALKKIQRDTQVSDMPVQGSKFAHMYLNHRSMLTNLFATHPPLEERIAVLEGEQG